MTTAKVNRGQARVTGKTRRTRTAIPVLPAVREEYRLSRSLFSRLLGVAESTPARWEKSGKVPQAAQARLARVAGLLKGLSRVIPSAELEAWLTRPNDACPSADGATPADLMAKGRYDKIEAMIYFFESGVAF